MTKKTIVHTRDAGYALIKRVITQVLKPTRGTPTVQETFDELAKRGEVERVGRGVYQITVQDE